MQSLAQEISQLSPARRALFELRLMRLGRGPQQGRIQPRRPGTGPLPLSFAQASLWFHAQLEPGSPVYNVTHAVRFRGPLHLAALAGALLEVERRHEVLRTRFVEEAGNAVQVIEPAAGVTLPLIDLAGLATGEAREAEVRGLARIYAERPYDLSRGPLLRLALLRLGGDEHLLVLGMHHIICDGWSIGIMAREVEVLYEALAAGRPSPLPELTLQYADYTLWQREQLTGASLDAALAYWRRQLSGAPQVLALPTDRPRSAAHRDRGGSFHFQLPGPLAADLTALCRSEGVTVYMMLLAGFRTLLARASGQDDLLVGLSIADRGRVELEGLIGFFVNVLVIRTNFPLALALREALARVREVVLDADAHKSLPFKKLVEELKPDRRSWHSPLCQVMFVLQNAPRPQVGISGLEAAEIEIGSHTTKYDLTLAMGEGVDGMYGLLEYSADLFDHTTVTRLAAHFETLLAGAVADPLRPLGDIEIWSAGERHQVLLEWNDSHAEWSGAGMLDDWIARQVDRTPDAVAAVCDGECLTYRELLLRAERWSRALSRRGIGAGDLVGLLMERSLALPVALLATLRAGAAYLPLDPDLPGARLENMLAQARPAAVLADAALAGRLGASAPLPLVLDPGGQSFGVPPGRRRDQAGGRAGRQHARRRRASPEDLAYVIFTSGSTGAPKAAMNSHRAIVNRLLWMQQRLPLRGDDRVLQKTPYSFDVSVWELFWPLIVGARLVLARPGEHRDATALVRLMRREAVTTLHFVPSMLAAVLAESELAQGALRRLVCSGETLSAALRDAFFARLGCELWNLYGPTEAAVDVTWERCEPAGPSGSSAGPASPPNPPNPPIGRPISNTRIHIVDRRGMPVPSGVVGELLIGGVGLARGYLRQPALAAEKFIPDGLSGDRGGRLYRTGDLARHLADGRIEFFGRADHQVKVRGVRIEPAEVEAALRRHPKVSEAVVVLRGDPPADRLVAYVVAGGPPAPGALELRELLGEFLPSAMVPTAYVFLRELPRTTSGKIDRGALPAPGGQPARGDGSIAPRMIEEELLAAIWAEVLGVEAVGVEDDFFDLGGHSLTATQVVSRIRDGFGVDLPVRALFEAPTVARLRGSIQRAREAGAAPQAPALRRRRHAGNPPLSFAQQRLWVLDRLEPDSAAYHLGQSLRLAGPLVPAALAAALSEVVRRHEALRTSFPDLAGTPAQRVAGGEPVPLPVVDLSGLEGDREAAARRLLAAESARPFDLARGPLLRTLLLRLAAGDHVALIVLHHIVADGWSLGILVAEVSALYESCLSGVPAMLPRLAVQYADFACWQREWLTGEVLAGHVEVWRRRLAGAPPLLELPTDRPRPSRQGFRGAVAPHILPAQVAAGVQRLSRAHGATPFILLLAAFQTLLFRYTRQSDIVVGSPIAGRNRRELEGLIGCLMNTLALRAELSGDPPFRALLAAARETALEAHAHQDLPFEKLVEELRPERSLGHSPIFQAMLLVQNEPRRDLVLRDVAVAPFPVGGHTSKFDLSLILRPEQGTLDGAIEYRPDLFDASTIARLWRSFERLLGAILEEPDRPVATLPLLGPVETHELLYERNDTAAGAAPAAGVHRLFERQVARHPDAVAVEGGGEALTYAELNASANRLARRLRRRGVGPEVAVGLCLERSPSCLVALLAVLKAGGFYLPLDPAYPAERLAFMLQDARPPVLLADSRLAAGLPATAARVVALDLELAEPPVEEAGDLAGGDLPASLAYLLYTSGSTGQPKGVQIPHAALANFLVAMRERPGLGRQDRLLAVTSLSFDIAALELYLPLVTGGRVVLADRAQAGDGRALCELLVSSGATVLQATAATWQLLLEAGWRGGDLRAFCGGEALPRPLAARLLDRASQVWNLYGPTETTVWSADHRVAAGGVATATAGMTVPIGRPIRNTDIHLLDGRLQPVPTGVAGELYIGGWGLARGYLRQAGLTAERFVPNPFAATPGGRLYRTGDLARRLGDGTVEFLGRRDQQVKIRGFRIELGEVETALAGHPGVAQAAAVANEIRPGERRLVAYFVPEPGHAPAAAELRGFLAGKLPEYMLPAHYLALAALPLTPNGKLDRGALPAPEHAWRGTAKPPSNPLEARLATLWAEVLERPDIGMDDDFFALGGHSLLAIRLVFRVEEELGVALVLRDLFAAPTVAEMALTVARLKADGAAPAATRTRLPGIVPDPAGRYLAFPLNLVQQAYWLGRGASFELGNVASHSYFEVEIPGLDLVRLERAVARLVARHDMLRVLVHTDGRQQVLAEVPAYRIEVLDLSSCPLDEAEARLLDQRERMSHQVLATDRWPLFELRASRLPDGTLRLHVSLDFLIADAWSNEILSREVRLFYRQPESELPPLELAFRDYVLAEAALAGTEPYRRAWQYWRERLADLPPAPELPLARRSPATPRFERWESRLEPERWRRLRERVAHAGLTPSGLLLAAFAEVLRAWSKSPRFTINLTLFNRLPLHPEVYDVVGDFTSLTLLAVEPEPGASFEARARSLQARLWEDLDHSLVSGLELLRELNRRDGGNRALMPVVFTSTLDVARKDPPAAAAPAVAEDGAGGAPEEGDGGRYVFGITQTPQVWLDHQVGESAGALVFNWDALAAQFPAGLLDAMFSAYCTLLDRLCDEPASWLEEAPLRLPPAELAARLAANATAQPLPADLLHEPFVRRAAEHPERIAVVAAGRSLTYGELASRAGVLAGRLVAGGACPGRLVAVAMEKGWEQVVAALAVVAAGAAYLPVDPALPAERFRHLLAVGEVGMALTQPGLAERLPWPAGVTPVVVSAEDPSTGGEGISRARALVDDLAYVIFTSGSTGLPKGVMIDHRGAVNTIVDLNRRFGVGRDDRVLALSSLSFDLSVYDIFGPLATGGAVVIPEPGALRDPGRWWEWIEQERVTIWNSVPALMEMLVEYRTAHPGRTADTLRLVMLSGDWIPVGLPDRIRALAPRAAVYSLGGATEASIWSVLFPIERVDREWSSIPYGRPMENQRLHVLDGALADRPVWVPGDLYIGGVGVARGYWRDPARTAAQFLTHPRTGEQLYRTGDLARYLPDGTLEFLGREDTQVKIQGHRIELGEVEAALERLPEVQAAVVEAAGERSAQRRLVGYVVLAAQTAGAGGPDGGQPQGEAAAPLELPRSSPEAPRLRRFAARRSSRVFSANPLDLARLAAWLECLAQLRLEELPLPKYRYPSAGSLYPVQAYLDVRPGRVEGLPAGTYYYHPRRRQLIALHAGTALGAELYADFDRPLFESSAFALLLVGDLAAISPVYGEMGRDFCLLEAGYMGELLMGEAAGAGIGLCPIGELDFAPLQAALALSPTHAPLHHLLGGGLPERAEPSPEVAYSRTGAVGAIGAIGELPRRFRPVETRAVPAIPLGEIELLELKLREPGLRRDDGGRQAIELPLGSDAERASLYRERQSHREFLDGDLSLAQLGILLSALRPLPGPEGARPHRLYPSAGGLYPVAVGLFIKAGRVTGVTGGTYGYDAEGHRLVPIVPGAVIHREIHAEVNRPIFDRSAFSIFLTARPDQVQPFYGGLARDFCLLEAGYLGQLLMTVAPDAGLGLCPLGSLEFAAIAGLFHQGAAEVLLHSFLGGGVALAAPGREQVARRQPPAAALVELLREGLRRQLPEYMVPAAFVVLDALPLSANGKVDRRALPAPQLGATEARRGFAPPSNDLERTIAAVWRAELELDELGVDDNFFELGGNSLHLIRAQGRLEQALGREIPVAELFKYPTISALAEHFAVQAAAAPAGAEVRDRAGRQRDALARQRRLNQKRTQSHE